MKITSFILLSTAAFALFACGSENNTNDPDINTAQADVVVGETTGTPNAITYPTEDKLLLARGEFEGRNEHTTTGGVYIVQKSDGYYVELKQNFSFDGAPDPVLGFGTDGEFMTTSKFAELETFSGPQSFKLSSDFDPASYDTIFIWCEQFAVPVGVAPLH